MALFCYFEWNYDNDEGEGGEDGEAPNLGIPEREFRLKTRTILAGLFSSVTRQLS